MLFHTKPRILRRSTCQARGWRAGRARRDVGRRQHVREACSTLALPLPLQLTGAILSDTRSPAHVRRGGAVPAVRSESNRKIMESGQNVQTGLGLREKKTVGITWTYVAFLKSSNGRSTAIRFAYEFHIGIIFNTQLGFWD